jgi:FkbM family methyltransferase
MHEIFWHIVPGVQYADSLKMAIRPRSWRRPDFPVHLDLSREITKRDVVLEAGANIGGNSRELPRYAKFVHSFEPSPTCYARLCRNVAKSPNIRCYNAALSGKSGTAIFNVEYGSGSLFDRERFTTRERVRVVGINDLPFSWNVGIFDVEGAEVPILEELKEWGGIDRLYVETHWIKSGPTFKECKKILKKHFAKVWSDRDPSGLYPWIIAKENLDRGSGRERATPYKTL